MPNISIFALNVLYLRKGLYFLQESLFIPLGFLRSMRIYLFLTLSFLLLPFWATGQKEMPSSVASCINLAKEKDPAMDVMRPFAKTHQLFLMGETHGVSINPKLILKFLRYFYDSAKVRYLIVEFGYSDAYLLNHYLKTGDKRDLDPLFYSQYEDYRKLWEDLYQFYVRLPREEKFEVIGIDYEYPAPLIKTLNMLIPKHRPIPEQIEPMISRIKSLENADLRGFKTRKFILKLRKDLQKNIPYYQSLFGYNFKHLERIVNNNAFVEDPAMRDKEMTNNIKRWRESRDTRQNVSFFGVMGHNHTDLNDTKSFAFRENFDALSPFAGKVFVINNHYEKCGINYNNAINFIETSFLHSCLGKKNAEILLEKITIKRKTCDLQLLYMSRTDLIQKRVSSSGQFVLYIRNQTPVN